MLKCMKLFAYREPFNFVNFTEDSDIKNMNKK